MSARKVLAYAAAAVVLSGGLAACGGDEGGGGGGGGMRPVVTIATGVDPSYSPIYVAKEKGFFEDHGVDVEYVTTEGGPAPTQALIAGQAQMATQSDATTLTLMGANPGLRALASFEESSTYIKVVFGKGITDPSQITKMAAVPGVATLATVRYLESVGVDPDDVELVSATPPDVPTLMQRGDVDGTVIYEPWASRAAEESGGEIVGSIGDFDFSYSQWMVTDEKWLADNQDAAAGVLAAIADADAFIVDDPEEAAEITEDAIKVPADQTTTIFEDLEFTVRGITDADVTQAKDSAQFFVDSGAVESLPDFDSQILLGWYEDNEKDS
jgi:NitT/TauT family transport system substrate-binding protein